MKKKKKTLLAGGVMLGALGCLLFALRGGRVEPENAAAPDDQGRSEGPRRSVRIPMPQVTNQRTPISGSPQRAFTPGLPTSTTMAVDEGATAPSTTLRARDHFYDRLLLRQQRDGAKEEQLLSRIMATFGDSPDTLVGAIGCSTEFCRVDLRGVGKVDVHARWQQELFAAVEPKGLKFFIVDTDDEGNTLASCYFGRAESWTVPDFHALGML